MTSESLLLISRETRNAREVLDTHAEGLTRRGVVDNVEIATYESEPVRELREQFEQLSADVVYAVPMHLAHTRETMNDVPGALSAVPGDVHYSEPLGRSPAVTDVIAERATAQLPESDDASLVLVGFGSSGTPYHRQTTDYHANRLRERSEYGEVLTCYLLHNPAVECVRYNVTESRAVVAPLFFTRTEATETRVPEKLELERGGIEYAEPFGKHPRITDAIEAEVQKQRALADGEKDGFETQVPQTQRPVATDGEGRQ
jgi:sirohydrochlorin ferrochelatase